jgi:hypothetical protein
MQMQLPRIHLNGSDPDSLLAQYMTALEKCQEAAQALNAIDVNARDYYPIGPAAWTLAQAEHSSRCAYLRQLIEDLSATAEHIQEHC